jgi:hypothetical protein
MLRWTHNIGMWGISFVATSFGWLLLLRVLALLSPEVASNAASDSDLSDYLHTIATAGLYQFTIGGVLAMVLKPDLPSKEHK